MKPIINAIKYWTNNKIEDSKSELNKRIGNSQADWNENNPEADNYVKNRTHWEEESEVTILEKQTINGFTLMQEPIYCVENAFSITPIIGKTYTVNWDGVDYKTTMKTIQMDDDFELGYMGNENYVSMVSGGDIPFAIVFGDGVFVVTESTAESHVISISTTETIIHPLDKKYLPDNFATITDVKKVETIANKNTTELMTIKEIDLSFLSNVNGICCGNNIIIAHNSNDTAYCYNGTWNQISIPFSSYNIIYGDGRFIATSIGECAYSNDGINWARVSSPAAKKGYSIAYGNGKFVLTSYDSDVILYSTDGINWKYVRLPYSTTMNIVGYGDGKFVIATRHESAAEERISYYSYDGINWNTTPYDFIYPQNIAYGNGTFVLIDYATGCHYSKDGIVWKNASSNIQMKYVVFGNGKFLSFSTNSNDYTAVYCSEDGVKWEKISEMPPIKYPKAVYSNNIFMVISSDADTAYYSKDDGQTWITTSYELAQNNQIRTNDVKNIILDGYAEEILDGYATEDMVNTALSTKADSTAVTEQINTKIAEANTYTDTAVSQKSQVQIITWEADD